MDSPTPSPKSPAGRSKQKQQQRGHRHQHSEPSSRTGSPHVKQQGPRSHQKPPQYVSGSETASPGQSKQTSRTNSPRRRNRTPNSKNNRPTRSGSQATQHSASDKETTAQLSQSDQVGQPSESDNNKTRSRRHRKTKSSHAASSGGLISSLDGTSASPINATPAKQAAYAGPTFHASPAASALPIPKFFARTAPTETGSNTGGSSQLSMQARLDAEETSKSEDAVPQREESPLDFFFNAHRAEKAKQTNTATPPHLTDQSRTTPSPHTAKSTPSDYLKARLFGTPTGAHATPTTQPHSTSKQALMMELDGVQDYHSDDTQAQTTSFKDRMNSMNSTPTPPQSSAYDEEQQRRTKSRALKNLLMNQQTLSPQRPDYRSPSLPGAQTATVAPNAPNSHMYTQNHFTSPPGRSRPQTRAMDINYGQPPQHLGQGERSPASHVQPVASTTMLPAGHSKQTADVKSMENDLRRILKLDG